MVKNVSIQGHEIVLKEYDGTRVVTFKDIDKVHERPEGTARKRFNDNKRHFIEGEDFYKITASEFRTLFGGLDLRHQMDVTLITESGYLMLVKSFTDNLAWKVQRDLVNNYFCGKEVVKKIMDFVNSAAAPNTDAPQRDITRDDYLRAANIVSSCKNERLPIVLNLIERAGISIPKVEPANSMTPHSEEIIEFVERPVPYDWDEWSLQQRRTYWSEEQYDEKYTLVPRRKICAAEVWCELFGGNLKDLTGGNNKSRDINKILSGMPLWERMKSVDRFGTAYGSQRGFRRCG